ncbi:MAG TPA: M56 family metallopeptidase [Candidatus Limnocylindrales bacterium]|nr:M56 family metallopeptidase [Candidatus Limnocylindrales bacterium]
MRADRAFGLVLALALVSSAILGALLARIVPQAFHVLTRGPDDVAEGVTLVVLVLATCGIALGLGSLLRQLLSTLALIRSLVARRVETPRRVARIARDLDVADRVDVVADARPFSFCFWFRSPRICISTALVRRLDDSELRAVLTHERYHLRHRDPLRVVVARYFAAGLYVVPVVDELAAFYALQKEIAADDDAVRTVGVSALARALYKLLPDAPDGELGLLMPVTGLSVTEARIERLAGGVEIPLHLSTASVMLSAGALAGAAILAAVGAGTSNAFAALPPLVAVPGLLVGPASLLFAAAVNGGVHQARLVAGLVARS